MKKIVTYIVIFISLTAFYVKADSCDGYELRLRDNLQKEEVESVKWCNINEIETLISKGAFFKTQIEAYDIAKKMI